VLLVEDEPVLRALLRDDLKALGFAVEEAATVERAKEVFRRVLPDVAVLDYLLPDGNAMDLLAAFQAVDPGAPLVLLTGHGSIDLAVRAMKAGAFYLLTKPVELPELESVLRRALAGRPARSPAAAGAAADAAREERRSFDVLLGQSRPIVELGRELAVAVRSEGPILIEGETGTGKGVLASWLHRHGPRRQKSFIDLNCAGLSPEFLESELFGHARGAFTGAVTEKKGLLELADQGTLFLDEMGDLSPEVQPKLLKALEEKRFRRMGEVVNRQVDMLLIAATHHDLRGESRAGSFRSDLYFRISTFPLRLPSLRERREDLPLIATQMTHLLCQELGRPEVGLTSCALAAITGYSWPGNLRELRNVLERALLRAPGPELQREDLRFEAGDEPEGLGSTLEEQEHRQIAKVLGEERGRVAIAARRLGISRSALYQKLRAGRIDLAEYQG